MKNPKWVVKAVEPREDYTLLLTFENGERKIYDAKPLLEKPIYFNLRSLPFFLTAKADGCSVCWNDEMDIAPEHLYEESYTLKDE